MQIESDMNPILNICRGAKVQLNGKNFESDWGHFNCAVGKVIEIIYEKGASPTDGTLPECVIVGFLQYRDLSWVADKPTWVQTPPIEVNCRSNQQFYNN